MVSATTLSFFTSKEITDADVPYRDSWVSRCHYPLGMAQRKVVRMNRPTPVDDTVRDTQALVVRRAILSWVRHGLKVNRAYTPGAMARTVGNITGLEYTSSKKSLQKAADDIAAMYPGVCK